jgi:subtilisin family serine protease
MDDNPSPQENLDQTPEPVESGEAPRHTRPLDGEQKPWLQWVMTRKGMITLTIASVVLLTVAIAGGWYLISQRGSASRQNLNSPPPPSLSELAKEYPELKNILTDEKLDSVYKEFMLVYQKDGGDAAYELAQKRGLLNAKGDLRLTLELDTNDTAALAAELEAKGFEVTAAHDNLMDVAIPIKMLAKAVEEDRPEELFQGISGLEHIVRIRLPVISLQDVGKVETESVHVIGADVWQAAGITGKGIKVGVLDRGFDSYRSLLGGDLPANVTVKSFIAGLEADQAGTVHGSAVAEIIHDIAPDAELFFAAYDTDVEQRQAIDWLISQGVRIISHSGSSIYGPMDGTGDDAVMVDQIVAGGVLWVNSAGNRGYTHYRATFRDDDGDGYHEFSPGDELMGFAPIGRTTLVLNWDDWQSGNQDLDLYVTDADGNEITKSTNVQNGPGSQSAEGLVYEFTDNGPYAVAFYASHIDRPVLMNFFLWDGELEYYTPEYSITTPGDSRSSLTVGAVNWSDDVLEDYSSRGPTSDGRLKPEISAEAGVSSAAYGSTWLGTSASTPHVSGAAALVLQVFPNYTPQQVTEFLLSRSLDFGPAGPDNGYGYGRLSLGAVPEAPPPVEPTPVEPTATQSALVPPSLAPTEPVVTPTQAVALLSTPVSQVVVSPKSSVDNSRSLGLILGLLACVVVPGLLGLGGVLLLGGVWYLRRSQPSPAPMPRSAAPRPGASSPAAAKPAVAKPVPPPPSPKPPPPEQPVAASPEPPPPAKAEPRCPRCGSPHRPEAKFCPTCGLDLQPVRPPQVQPSYCRNCGEKLRRNSKFCPRCGTPVSSSESE